MFVDFIDCFGLVVFYLDRASFTHRSTRGSLSRLDRFMVNTAWVDMLGTHRISRRFFVV